MPRQETYEQSGRDIYALLAESVDTAEKEPCRVCGEYMTRFGRTCRRCERNLQEERDDA